MTVARSALTLMECLIVHTAVVWPPHFLQQFSHCWFYLDLDQSFTFIALMLPAWCLIILLILSLGPNCSQRLSLHLNILTGRVLSNPQTPSTQGRLGTSFALSCDDCCVELLCLFVPFFALIREHCSIHTLSKCIADYKHYHQTSSTTVFVCCISFVSWPDDLEQFRKTVGCCAWFSKEILLEQTMFVANLRTFECKIFRP